MGLRASASYVMQIGMRQLTDLPIDCTTALNGRNLIVFDGECILCSGFFRFMLRHDSDLPFDFATAQSPLGQRLYAALELPRDDFETNLVFVDGTVYGNLDAFAVAMGQLGWPLRLLSGLRWLPHWIKMPVYRLIARNRYRIFGRYDTCLMPNAKQRARFAPEGY